METYAILGFLGLLVVVVIGVIVWMLFRQQGDVLPWEDIVVTSPLVPIGGNVVPWVPILPIGGNVIPWTPIYRPLVPIRPSIPGIPWTRPKHATPLLGASINFDVLGNPTFTLTLFSNSPIPHNGRYNLYVSSVDFQNQDMNNLFLSTIRSNPMVTTTVLDRLTLSFTSDALSKAFNGWTRFTSFSSYRFSGSLIEL